MHQVLQKAAAAWRRWLGSSIREPASLAVEDVFTTIYRENRWTDSESRSGPGSTLARTLVIRQLLERLVRELRIKTLLDAPCGDFNWMKEVALPVETQYIGVDVVRELIADLQGHFATPRRRFLALDFVRDRLPRAELIFCRDALVHLTLADIQRALDNFRRSGSKYLLATTFPATSENLEIATGGWRTLNLERPPFNLPAPVQLHSDGCPHPEYADKALGLWLL